MFIRKTSRTYKGRTYSNYLLVESVRTPKGPRQKVVCSLGDLSPRPQVEWLELSRHLEATLSRQPSLFPTPPSVTEHLPVHLPGSVPSSPSIEHPQASPAPSDSKAPPAADTADAAVSDIVAVHANRVTTERHREAGTVHVGYHFWQRVELSQILSDVGLPKRACLLACAMTLNRLIEPRSEHAMPAWIRSTALEDLLDHNFDTLTEDALYRILDALHPVRERIEIALVQKERTVFNLDQTILLYDLTSTYFEGQALQNPKAKRGYSRDKRADCKQVVVGLVVNRDGFPLAHVVLEGNTLDRKTLKDTLDLLDKRVGLKPGQLVVVDRGMAYDENLSEIKSRNLQYLVASRQPERNQWLADFEDTEGFVAVVRTPSPTNPCQKKSEVKVKMKRTEEETHVLCIGSGRIQKDRAIREKHEKRLLADLAKLEKRIREGRLTDELRIGQAIGRLRERYPRVARYYPMQYDPKTKVFTHERDDEKHTVSEELDGSYLLKTNRKDISADEAWRIYSLLTRAEAAFRAMKSPLGERPIHHHVEARVETHIFLCVLAYHLLVAIEKTLLDKGDHRSWGTVRDALATHQVSTVVLPTTGGFTLRIRKGSTPEPEHEELYRLLGVPSEVVAPKKTWVLPEAVAACSDVQMP